MAVQFLPRDFMKLGQLMSNGGTWQGRRILSSDFVARASSPFYQLGSRRYVYLWWVWDYPQGDRTFHAYAALPDNSAHAAARPAHGVAR